jgi:hypothetical protein
MGNMQYTLQVLEAYEDEVSGAAYFDGLALAYPQQSAFLRGARRSNGQRRAS